MKKTYPERILLKMMIQKHHRRLPFPEPWMNETYIKLNIEFTNLALCFPGVGENETDFLLVLEIISSDTSVGSLRSVIICSNFFFLSGTLCGAASRVEISNFLSATGETAVWTEIKGGDNFGDGEGGGFGIWGAAGFGIAEGGAFEIWEGAEAIVEIELEFLGSACFLKKWSRGTCVHACVASDRFIGVLRCIVCCNR